MAKHRSHSVEFKRRVAQEFLAGETLHGLAKRHDLSRNLIRVWVEKYEAGVFDEDARAADMIAGIRGAHRRARVSRRQAGAGAGVPKGGSAARTPTQKRAYVRDHRPDGLSIAEGCRLMGIARSTFYDKPQASGDDTALVEAMHAIKDEFEAYGWRRMQAALRQQGWAVNHKKIRRLMREHGLRSPRRRRFVITTDSDHDQPIFPNRTRELAIDGPGQLWVADLTYVTVAIGFVYIAAILDAWSRRIVGFAIGRRIDARLTLAALTAAIELRRPPPGCVHHSDRGSQGGFKRSSHQSRCWLIEATGQAPLPAFSN
jgi:transposase-like protein